MQSTLHCFVPGLQIRLLCWQGSEHGVLFAACSDHTCSLPDTFAACPTEKDVLDTSQPEEVLLDENKEAEEHEFYMVRHRTRAYQGLLGPAICCAMAGDCRCSLWPCHLLCPGPETRSCGLLWSAHLLCRGLTPAVAASLCVTQQLSSCCPMQVRGASVSPNHKLFAFGVDTEGRVASSSAARLTLRLSGCQSILCTAVP